MIRGVRGATTVERNNAAEITARTAELLHLLVRNNGIRAEEVASVIFTVTEDLDAEFPAVAARALAGWDGVPLMCGREIPVPGSLAKCIRVLIYWNTERPQHEIEHAFLHGARVLRPSYAVRVAGDDEEHPSHLERSGQAERRGAFEAERSEAEGVPHSPSPGPRTPFERERKEG